MSHQQIAHGNFAIERIYDATRARVFSAWADPAVKARWFVFTYDMRLSGRHHSVSLATVELAPSGRGTRLIFTEQVAFLDGTDGNEGTVSRQLGTAAHLDRLALQL
jgi:uncharacterized protein YndB with AHSA1/START domain